MPSRTPEPKVDIWSYRDDILQSSQKHDADTERRRTYLGVYDLATATYVQLGSPDVRDVERNENADVALGSDDRAGQRAQSWLGNFTKVTTANPERETFRWGTDNFVDYRATDGTPLRAVMLVPDDASIRVQALSTASYPPSTSRSRAATSIRRASGSRATKTKRLRAVEAGAAVDEMIGAYGGIRLESGIVRESQYEHTQSRIGATPWDRPDLYLENSGLFGIKNVTKTRRDRVR